MYQKSDYIAVFDSGVGGISVLRQLKKCLPNERFLYYGDSAHAPYGTRPTEQVRQLALEAVGQILCKPIKALVVACNTATAAAITLLRETYPDLIIVGIEPALKLAADHFPGRRIGVMATPVTLREEKFDVLLHRFESSASISKIPAPGLVELVEAGRADSAEAEALLRSILTPYVGQLDALVLGCTHYPFAAKAIRNILGPQIVLLDGGEGTARETKRRLQDADLLYDGPGEILWQNSAQSEALLMLCKQLLSQ